MSWAGKEFFETKRHFLWKALSPAWSASALESWYPGLLQNLVLLNIYTQETFSQLLVGQYLSLRHFISTILFGQFIKNTIFRESVLKRFHLKSPRKLNILIFLKVWNIWNMCQNTFSSLSGRKRFLGETWIWWLFPARHLGNIIILAALHIFYHHSCRYSFIIILVL